ncbi:MAG TPA: hypothetical protein VGG99_19375 [Acetobacteraceae bacterium]|jgi:hypothetical protein
MTGLELYLLIAPMVLLALAWAYAWWWVRQGNKGRTPPKSVKPG